MDEELEILREEALKAIMALPSDKRKELWDILHSLKGSEQHR